MKKRSLEEIIAALSLSNLLFVASWRKLIYPNSESYHIKLEAYPLDYLGTLISVLATALIFLGCLFISRKLNGNKTPLIAKLGSLAVFVIVLNGIRLQFYESEAYSYVKILAFILLSLVTIVVLIKWHSIIFSALRTILLIFSPFLLITFSQGIIGSLTAKPTLETPIDQQLAAITPKDKPSIKNRIIWIIFDEMDYFVPFGSDRPMVELPEFNRLRSESIFATQASSPAYTTIASIPSLITGRTVVRSKPEGKNELRLKFADNSTAEFSKMSSVFSEVMKMGGETAVVGWYHSYCRVIGKDLSACQWESMDIVNDFEARTLPRIVLNNFQDCLISVPFGFRLVRNLKIMFYGKIDDNDYVKRHNQMMSGAKSVLENPNIDLAFIHLPFPHRPNHYDRLSGTFVGESSYLDNLVLSDRVLGELRKTLEAKGLWDKSTVIISSDHQWRWAEYRPSPESKDFSITQGVEHPNIPFILKLKEQKEAFTYDQPFNTILTRDLILDILKGNVSSPQQTVEWLNKNSIK